MTQLNIQEISIYYTRCINVYRYLKYHVHFPKHPFRVVVVVVVVVVFVFSFSSSSLLFFFFFS